MPSSTTRFERASPAAPGALPPTAGGAPDPPPRRPPRRHPPDARSAGRGASPLTRWPPSPPTVPMAAPPCQASCQRRTTPSAAGRGCRQRPAARALYVRTAVLPAARASNRRAVHSVCRGGRRRLPARTALGVTPPPPLARPLRWAAPGHCCCRRSVHRVARPSPPPPLTAWRKSMAYRLHWTGGLDRHLVNRPTTTPPSFVVVFCSGCVRDVAPRPRGRRRTRRHPPPPVTVGGGGR